MSSKYKSRLAQEVSQHVEALQSGYMLAIDPSSGSQGSLPGYAVFKAGRLEDAGTIALPKGTRAIANRLWQLRVALESEFPKPDILAVELISPVMPSGKGGGFLHKGASSLIKAMGAILSVWDVPVLEPSPMTWHRLIDEAIKPAKYDKNDVNDAICIGWSALVTLALVRGEPVPPAPTFPPVPGRNLV